MPSRIRAYLQLLRLPAVFTAMADVLMGVFVAGWSSGIIWDDLPWRDVIPLLVAASTCLYLSGMVLNDYFDWRTDAVERPERPIPSGRVSARTAARLGATLLVAGVLFECAASYFYDGWLPAGLALGLAACVLLYDAVLKKTPLGPLAMGACRSLNVLMGMSIAIGPWQAPHYLIAGGLGLYVAGLTWISRSEAGEIRPRAILGGLLLILLGIAAVAWFPRAARFVPPSVAGRLDLWFAFWIVLGLQISYRVLQAILEPAPTRVQAAVKHGILSLVMIDAAITFAVAGKEPALVVLALLVPAIVLGRWLYVT